MISKNQRATRTSRSQYLPMDDDDAWSFVRSHYKMLLATVDRTGFPQVTPVWYVMIGKRIFFRAQPYKKKIKNILARAQVCAVVEDGEKYTELRGVMIQGFAKIVDNDKQLRKQIFSMLAEKYAKMRDTDRMPKSWQSTFGREHRVVVEIRPTNIVSWDNRKWIPTKTDSPVGL
jgi:PPOX class probable F420-dependent enzyme